MVLIYIFLLVIATFSVMSYLSLRKLNNNSNTTGISDERYYELKYKLQFISSIGVIIIGVCGFFGYDKMDNFIEEFEKKNDSLNYKFIKFNEKLAIIDSTVQSYDSKITKYNHFLKKLDFSKNKISKDILSSNQQLRSLTDTIDIIKKRNILDKSFYVIDNLQIESNGTAPKKFYFKDMVTILGDKLPEFDKKPVLFVIPQTGVDLIPSKLTTEYVEITYGNYYTENVPSWGFGILIAKRLR